MPEQPQQVPNPYENMENPNNIRFEFCHGTAIHHDKNNFFITFAQMNPPSEKGMMISRMVFDTDHFRAFTLALLNNLKTHDSRGGDSFGNPDIPTKPRS